LNTKNNLFSHIINNYYNNVNNNKNELITNLNMNNNVNNNKNKSITNLNINNNNKKYLSDKYLFEIKTNYNNIFKEFYDNENNENFLSNLKDYINKLYNHISNVENIINYIVNTYSDISQKINISNEYIDDIKFLNNLSKMIKNRINKESDDTKILILIKEMLKNQNSILYNINKFKNELNEINNQQKGGSIDKYLKYKNKNEKLKILLQQNNII